jgi:tetratricopeptide (TPR) repeat protein
MIDQHSLTAVLATAEVSLSRMVTCPLYASSIQIGPISASISCVGSAQVPIRANKKRAWCGTIPARLPARPLLCPYVLLSSDGYCAMPSSSAKNFSTVADHVGEPLTRDVALLYESLQTTHEALDLLSDDHPEKGAMYSSLALEHRQLYNVTGEIASLETATDLSYQAIMSLPEDAPARPGACLDLASSHRAMYRVTSDMQELEYALDYGMQALDLCPSEHPDRARFCMEHALSLKEHYSQTGNLEYLSNAIVLEREAIELCHPPHADRAASCHNLAFSLAERLQQSGDLADLDEAITLEREALLLLPHDYPERASSCINLASMLRYQYPGDEVMELSREAVNLRPTANPDRALACSNLAVSLAEHAERRWAGDREAQIPILDEAIAHEREALSLLGLNHPARVVSCTHLATLLIRRFAGEIVDEPLMGTDESYAVVPLREQTYPYGALASWIAEVRDGCLDAIRLSSSGQRHVARCRAQCSLANLYLIPWTQLFSPDAATLLLRTASDPHLVGLYDGVVLSLLLQGLRALVRIPDRKAHSLTELVPVFRHAIERLQLSANVVAQKESQLRRMRDGSSAAVYVLICAARARNLRAAVELSQQALIVLWSQALHLRDPQLDLILRVPALKEVSAMLQDVLATLAAHDRGLSTSVPNLAANTTPRDFLHGTGAQLQELVSKIRRSPGLNRFMRGHSYEELARAAQTHPIVILTAEGQCCHAVILSSSSTSPTYLCLPGSVPRVLLSGSDGPGSRTSTHPDRAMGTRRRGPTFESGLEVLWLKAVKPILECLGIKASLLKLMARL